MPRYIVVEEKPLTGCLQAVAIIGALSLLAAAACLGAVALIVLGAVIFL